MAKEKFYGSKLPNEVKMTSYPKLKGAISQGSYVDTQPEMDAQFHKAISKVKKSLKK